MSLLRLAADVTVGLAAILAAVVLGGFCGLFAFVLLGWVILLCIGGGEMAALAILLAFVGFGSFFGLAVAAAFWREGEALQQRGPF